jgi:hypothetical protein
VVNDFMFLAFVNRDTKSQGKDKQFDFKRL